MTSNDILAFIASQKETLDLISMLRLTEPERRREEEKVLEAVYAFLVGQCLTVAQMVFAIFPRDLLERVLHCDNRLYCEAAAHAFDLMALDDNDTADSALRLYTRARELGLATALTLRLFLSKQQRGFFNQYDRRRQLPQLYASVATAEHIFAGLYDDDRSVVAGALKMIESGLSELLQGRLAKTESGYRFSTSSTDIERRNAVRAAQWLRWPCYARKVKWAELPCHECDFIGGYHEAISRQENGTVSETVNAEVTYFQWRGLVFKHFCRLLELLDTEPNAQSFNSSVFSLLEHLGRDNDREVAVLFLSARERILAFHTGSPLCTVAGPYNYGIGDLTNLYPQFEQQVNA